MVCPFGAESTAYGARRRHRTTRRSGAARWRQAGNPSAPCAAGSRSRWGGRRPPQTASRCASVLLCKPRSAKGGKMKNTMIGVDLARHVCQAHGASMRGAVPPRPRCPEPSQDVVDHPPVVHPQRAPRLLRRRLGHRPFLVRQLVTPQQTLPFPGRVSRSATRSANPVDGSWGQS